MILIFTGSLISVMIKNTWMDFIVMTIFGLIAFTILVLMMKYVGMRLFCLWAINPTNPDEEPVKYTYVNKKHK